MILSGQSEVPPIGLLQNSILINIKDHLQFHESHNWEEGATEACSVGGKPSC